MLSMEGARQLGKAIEKVAVTALNAEAQTACIEEHQPNMRYRLVPWHPKRGRCVRLRAEAERLPDATD